MKVEYERMFVGDSLSYQMQQGPRIIICFCAIKLKKHIFHEKITSNKNENMILLYFG